jgi:hypothetical protein
VGVRRRVGAGLEAELGLGEAQDRGSMKLPIRIAWLPGLARSGLTRRS